MVDTGAKFQPVLGKLLMQSNVLRLKNDLHHAGMCIVGSETNRAGKFVSLQSI